MIRFLLTKFKKAPGPLKKTRIFLADLAEEILDVIHHHRVSKTNLSPCASQKQHESEKNHTEKKNNQYYCCSSIAQDAKPTQTDNPKETEQSVKSEKTKKSPPKKSSVKKANSTDLSIDSRLKICLKNHDNLKSQSFKIMAILWLAHSKERGELTAKEIAELGQNHLGITIRHENVRKIIRINLSKYVTIKQKNAGKRPTNRYQISKAGVKYFESAYFVPKNTTQELK